MRRILSLLFLLSIVGIFFWNVMPVSAYIQTGLSWGYGTPVCSTTTKFVCDEGTAGSEVTWINSYDWMCESGYQFGLDLNSEPQLPAACSLERCGDVAMKAGDECCDNQILDKTRPETCCTMAKALERPAGRSALEHSNGALIGPNETICTPNAPTCFIRRLCSDKNDNEVHGEHGDSTVTCNHEIICAFAIMHSCNKDRPNRNCQDECRTELGYVTPDWCAGGGGFDGECGATYHDCLVGISEITPGVTMNWMCLGSEVPPGNDVLCPGGAGDVAENGVCGASHMLCTSSAAAVDRVDTAVQYLWMCPGTHPEIGGRDAFCSTDKPACPWAAPVVKNTCLRGTVKIGSETEDADSHDWSCEGNGGLDVVSCTQVKPKDGICGAALDTCVYSSNFNLASYFGRNATQFTWTCLADLGGVDALCDMTCPPGQMADPNNRGTCIATDMLYATNCTIPLGSGSCNTSVTWITSSAVSPVVISVEQWWNSWVEISRLPTGVNKLSPIPYGVNDVYLLDEQSGTTITNYIDTLVGYDFSSFPTYGIVKLRQTTATASCAAGTIWDWGSSTCIGVPSGIISATNCTIPAGASSCATAVTWTTQYTTSPAIISVDEGNTSWIDISSATAGINIPKVIPYGVNDIYLLDEQDPSSYSIGDYISIEGYNFSYLGFYSIEKLHQTTATATCVAGTTWNGTVCAGAPSGMISATNCTISAGGSTCDIAVTWTTQYATIPAIISVNEGKTAWLPISNLVTGVNVSQTVPYGINDVYLLDEQNGSYTIADYINTYIGYDFSSFPTYGIQILRQTTATAACIAGTTWNGTVCAGIPPSGSISATNCTIPAGGSTCDIAVTWTTQYATSPAVVSVDEGKTSWIDISSVATGVNVFQTVPYGINDVYLFEETFWDVATFVGAVGVWNFDNYAAWGYGIELGRTTATASCTPGTTWDGAICKGVDPITASCYATPATVGVGIPVTWTVTMSGGTGAYDVFWSGSDGLAGDTTSFQWTYALSGTKQADVLIKSGDQITVASCTASVTVPVDTCNNILGVQIGIPTVPPGLILFGGACICPATTYTVTYNGNGNTGGTVPIDAASPYVVGATVTVKANTGALVRTNYTFNGWNTAANGSGTPYAATGAVTFSMPASNVVLYAQWTAVYTITFDKNNVAAGGSMPNQTITSGATAPLNLNTFIPPTGLTFTGWATTSGGSVAYADGADYTMGNANVTLYAQWNGISVTLKATPAGPFHWNPDPVAFNEGATDLSWITTGDPDECFPTGLEWGPDTLNIKDLNHDPFWHLGPPPPLDEFLHRSGMTTSQLNGGVYKFDIVCKKASFPDATSSVTVNIYSGTLSTPNDSLNPCFIPANASSCDVTLSWNTINPPVGFTSAVTTDPGITVLAANSSPGTQYPVNGNPGNRVFYLYNSGNELAKVTAYAECTPGTSWVAGKCSSGGGTHTVTYAANGGIGVLPATATYDVGDTVTVAPQGVLLNGALPFGGWVSDYTWTTYFGGDTFIMPDKDVILSARWTGPADGCLSDGTINKNLDNYKGNLLGDYGLLKRVYDSTEAPIIAPATTRTEKRGYLLSDPARKTQTQTFQTKLSSNINTYIKSKYCSAVLGDPGVDSTWNDHALTDSAFMKNPNATCSIEPNRNGYYYYQGGGTFRLLNVSRIDPATTGGELVIKKPTVLYVVGANIQIYNDISYSTASGDTPSLVIIVQKDSGGTGGNVYVDPSVTKINATIIADGALMNGISGTPQNWLQNDAILNSRLQINGKLLTYNTRGGSLKKFGNNLIKIDQPGSAPFDTGTCIGNTITSKSCHWQDAAAQDLERFRMISDGVNNQCSLYVSGVLPARQPDILTTLSY